MANITVNQYGPNGPFTINDGSLDNTLSLTLVGNNALNYGPVFANNTVKHLSNFANTTAPSGQKLVGQLWYDTSVNTLRIWNGAVWQVLYTNNSTSTEILPPAKGGTGMAPDATVANKFLLVDSTGLNYVYRSADELNLNQVTKQQFIDLSSRVTVVENTNASQDTDLSALKSRMTAAEGRLDTDETNISNAQINITNLQTSVSNVQGSVSALQTRMSAAESNINLKANINSPSFTGAPLTPTPAAGDASTKIASTAFVSGAVNTLASNTYWQFVGIIAYYPNTYPPAGWLPCNGAAISRTTYSALFNAIGTMYGAGDGWSTFNLPDLRGEFIRGWDAWRGVDNGRGIGSWQDSQNRWHGHGAWTDSQGNHLHGGGWGLDASISTGRHGIYDYTQSVGSASNDWNNAEYATSTNGLHGHNVGIGGDGGDEARPRNVALLACIRY